MFSAAVLLSACSTSPQVVSESVQSAQEICAADTGNDQVSTQEKVGTETPNPLINNHDYLSQFRIMAERNGFDVYDVTHHYTDSGLLCAGMAEEPNVTQIFIYIFDSETSAEKKKMELVDSLGDGEDARELRHEAVLSGRRYLVDRIKNATCMIISPEDVDFATMEMWMNEACEETDMSETNPIVSETDN